MILVDSSVWIDYFNGISTWQTDQLDNYLSNVPVIIGDLILTEVLQGFKSDKDFEADTMSPFKVPRITGNFEKPGLQ